MKKFACILSIAMVLGFSAVGNATLWDRGNGMIYDDFHKITWLQDVNYALTSGYTSSYLGWMSWNDAMTWAQSLVYEGYDDWRLPTVVPGAWGESIASSEMEYMYYQYLGNTPNTPTPNATFTDGYGNRVSFQNLLGRAYWTNTEYSPSPTHYAWSFHFYLGDDMHFGKGTTLQTWAVRDGDVAVPEPTTMLLLALGLIGLAGVRRKLRK